MKRTFSIGICLASVVLTGLFLAGCGQKEKSGGSSGQTAENQPAAQAPAETPPPTPPVEAPATRQPGEDQPARQPVGRTETPRRPARRAPAPETPKGPAEVTVPAGTVFTATLQTALASHESKAGDAFTLAVKEPVVVAGYVAIPAGAIVNGEVVEAKPSGKIKGRGDITLAFKSVTDAAGATHPIDAENFYAQAKSATGRDAGMIAGGAGAGAVIGGIVGGGKGAAIGGLIGAAAGTGTVLATSGPQVKLTPGSVFKITLNTSVYLPPGPKAGS